MERDKLSRELQSAEARLKVGEKSCQDLTEEYATLKKNYRALAEAHDKELDQSEELSAELLALARAQEALRRQLQEQQQSVNTATHGLHGELYRVQALISRMSHNRVKVRKCANRNGQKGLLVAKFQFLLLHSSYNFWGLCCSFSDSGTLNE